MLEELHHSSADGLDNEHINVFLSEFPEYHDKGFFHVVENEASLRKCLKVKQLREVLRALPESYTLSPDLSVFNETCECIGYIDFLGHGSFIRFLSD